MQFILNIDELALQVKEYYEKTRVFCEESCRDFFEHPDDKSPAFEDLLKNFYKFLIDNDLFKNELINNHNKCEKFIDSDEFRKQWNYVTEYYKNILQHDGYNYTYLNLTKFNINGPITSVLYKRVVSYRSELYKITDQEKILIKRFEDKPETLAKLLEVTDKKRELVLTDIEDKIVQHFIFSYEIFAALVKVSAYLNSEYKELDKNLYENCIKALTKIEEKIGDYACFYVLREYILSNEELKGLNIYFIAIAIKEICDKLSLLLKNESKNLANKRMIFEKLCHSASLTKREKEILQLSLEDFSNKEIAQKIGISVKSVENNKNKLAPKIKTVMDIEEQSNFKDIIKALKNTLY